MDIDLAIKNADKQILSAIEFAKKNDRQNTRDCILRAIDFYYCLYDHYVLQNNGRLKNISEKKIRDLLQFAQYTRTYNITSVFIDNLKKQYEGKTEPDKAANIKAPQNIPMLQIDETEKPRNFVGQKENINLENTDPAWQRAQEYFVRLRNLPPLDIEPEPMEEAEKAGSAGFKPMRNLRPQKLEDYFGQERIKMQLRTLIDAAKERNDALEHILIYGTSGLGKTTLAHIISNEMDSQFIELNGVTLKEVSGMVNVLKTIKEKDIVFIDEIHALSPSISDALLTVLEDFKLSYISGRGDKAENINLKFPRFTCIGATTHPGNLSKPMFDRLVHKLKMEPYSLESLQLIVIATFDKLGLKIEEEAAMLVAKRGRGTPRIVNNYVKGIRDKAQIEKTEIVTEQVVEEFFEGRDIDENGLTPEDRTVLLAIIEKFDGGPVSLKTLSGATGENENIIENQIEPYLIYLGLINIATNGRVATLKAYEYFGKK